jgi:tRNA threonylcarbamoyladenosine biosynthesis protein TsaE
MLKTGDVVALEGDLGSGKTVLVQGLAEGLGVQGQVHSPTFVIHHRYPGRVPLDHYDLYRLNGLSWLDSGLDEPSPESITVIEWSQRAAPLEEWATIRLRLEVLSDNDRQITVLDGGERLPGWPS